MKKLLVQIIIIAFLTPIATFSQTGLVYHHVQVVNELNQEVDVTQVEIYKPGTTSYATIYKERDIFPITQPMTTSSTNTTLSGGRFTWWGPDGWDYKITTSTHIQSSEELLSLNASDNLVVLNIAVDSDLYALAANDYTADINALRITTKLDPVNVKAYGAVGDGVTDDTAAIQAAETAAAAAGAVVYFPPGTYKLMGSLTGTAPEYRGVRGKSILKQTTASTPIFNYAFMFEKVFSGLTFDTSVDDVAAFNQTSTTNYTAYCTWRDCEFYLGLKYGIKAILIFANIENSRFGYLGNYNASSTHIQIYSQGVQGGKWTNINRVVGSQFFRAKGGNAAVDLLTGADWYFESCDFESLKTAAVYAKGIYGITFQNCWFEPKKAEGSGADYIVYGGTDGTQGTRLIKFDQCWFTLPGSTDTTHFVEIGSASAASFQGCGGNLNSDYLTKYGATYDSQIYSLQDNTFFGYAGSLNQYAYFAVTVNATAFHATDVNEVSIKGWSENAWFTNWTLTNLQRWSKTAISSWTQDTDAGYPGNSISYTASATNNNFFYVTLPVEFFKGRRIGLRGIANRLTGTANAFKLAYNTTEATPTNMTQVGAYFLSATFTESYGVADIPSNASYLHVGFASGGWAGTGHIVAFDIWIVEQYALIDPTFTGDWRNPTELQLGANGADGKVILYSEQGATDYLLSINPNATMTSNADFFLPADEPAATSLVTMTTGGVMGYLAPNAGTDVTADLEEETHAAEHAVSGADTVFPADPAADRYLMWDDDPGALVWATPAGGGDMLVATYDTDVDGDIDVAAGGTEKSSWTQYAIPYLSAATTFGEIPIGTAGQYLKVAVGATGYEFGTIAGGGDLLADGTVPLTANWNVGAFNITASTFIGALTGTASGNYTPTGTDVAVADGGTGKSSWTQWLIPYASNTTTFSQIAIGTAGQVLKSGGAGVAPAFAAESDPTVDTSAEIQAIIGAAVYEPAGVAVADITDASANGRSLISAANYAAMKALLDLEIGIDVQAYDADLTTWAGVTPTANGQSLVSAANYAAMRALLDLEAGTDFYSMSAADTAFISPSEIDTFAELDAIVADKALVNKTDGAVWLGVHDFGGATSVEVPNGANPTTDAAGEIAVDSSATSGSMIRFYGDAAYALPAYQTKSFVITKPVATSDYPLWRVPYAITIRAVHVLCVGGTNIVGHLTEQDGNGLNDAGVDGATDITGTAATNVDDDASLSNPTIDAGDYVGWRTTSISGTPTSVTVSFEFTVTQVN